jgi:hypothetical protein
MTPVPKPQPRPKKARKPLKRSRMKRKRARRLSKPGSDRAYLTWLHTRPCVGFAFYPSHICNGGLQASHLRHHTGLGLKEPDRNAISMCREYHEHWEQHRGPFRGMTNLQRFAMFTLWIADTQAAYARATSREP